MEDAHVISEASHSIGVCCIYAIYDGHGGSRVAKVHPSSQPGLHRCSAAVLLLHRSCTLASYISSLCYLYCVLTLRASSSPQRSFTST